MEPGLQPSYMNHRSRRIHRAFAFLLAAFVAAGVSFSYPSASAQISAAKELISQQRFAEAQAILERLLEQTEEPAAEAHYQLAVCHARQGRTQVADRTLDAALKKEPGHLPALHLKAYIRFSTGRYQEAIEWADQYLKKQPGGGDTRKISGLAHFMLGDKAAAESDLKQAAHLLPQDFDAQYYLGRVYFERSKLRPALESFRSAIALRPQSVKAHNHLGQTLEGLTRFDEAKGAYQKAIELEQLDTERSEWPYYNLGSLLLSEGDASQAVALLEQALERNPPSVQTKTKLGVALSAASRHDDATRQLRAAVKAEPGNPDAHFQLGRLLMKLGKVEEAREHLTQFERLREP